MKYRVIYEVRGDGDIGRYDRRSVIVDALDRDNAVLLAFELLHKEGYGTRFPRKVEKIEDNRDNH